MRDGIADYSRATRSLMGVILGIALLAGCERKGDTEYVEVGGTAYVYDPPLAFSLLAPANGDALVPVNTKFSWSTSLGAFSYRLQVSTTADFSALVIDQSSIAATSYLNLTALAGSTLHWWRVYAVNGTALTLAEGAPHSFTTVSAANSWLTVGSDARHTGYNATETGVPPLISAWNVALSTGALRPVVCEGGRVFASVDTYFSTPTLLTALDSSDGSTLWAHDFGDVFGVGQPSVSEGRVFVGQCDHTPGTFLWSFNAVTGALNWASPVSAQWETYWAPIVAGSSVYMNGGYYGGLYGFNATTGAQLFFNSSLEQYDEWSPAYDNNTLYTFISGNLRAHNPSSGVILWTVSVTWNWAGWSMQTCPVVGGGRIYVIAPPVLYAINPVTRLVDWQTSGFSYSKMPAYAAGVVYAISGGILHARDGNDGTLLWSLAGDTALNHPPVVAGGHVYVSSDANVYAARVSDGQQVWTSAVGGWLTIAGGKLFVARANGVLSAYTLSP